MTLVHISNVSQSQTFNKFKAYKAHVENFQKEVRLKLWEMTIEGTSFK
jgi:hypothetical protein